MIKNLFSTAEHMEGRFWEIDILRGFAIIMMVASNFILDLDYFNIYPVNSNSGFWWFFARTTAVIFVFLAGVSLTLSYSRAHSPPWLKYLKRGLKIFGWGIIITFLTWIFIGNDFVIFGILHLIGLSIILAYPLLNYRFFNLFLGAGFIAAWIFFKSADIFWLFWLAPQLGIHSVDYTPLVPWFSAVLIGIFIGNTLYPKGIRSFKIINFENFFSKALCFLGRNSLLIYLIHQPILILLLKILSG